MGRPEIEVKPWFEIVVTALDGSGAIEATRYCLNLAEAADWAKTYAEKSKRLDSRFVFSKTQFVTDLVKYTQVQANTIWRAPTQKTPA